MAGKNDVAKLERRLEEIKRSLLATGPVAQGSILRRTIRRPDPARPGRTKEYGPYYQWTRKVASRTTIQNLSPAQAKVYARAIRENRRLEETVSKLRIVSLKLLELSTTGVARRKRKTEGQEALS